jgi:protein-tyrosine phosphatase
VGLIRRLADRALHPFRARKVRDRLGRLPVQRILAVCHGNVCRSPFLQASLTAHLAALGRSDMEIRSAGFVGSDRPSPELAIAVAGEMGFDLRSHRSATLKATDLQTTDLIVVMSGEQAMDVRWRGAPSRVPIIVLGDLDPQNTSQRTIVDPWNCSETVFRDSYRRIDRCAKELANLIASNRL